MAGASLQIEDLDGMVFDGWRPLRLLGAGASAGVFLSTNHDGDRAALKVFKPEITEKYGDAVQLERISRQLELRGKTHPNLSKVYSGGRLGKHGFFYLVMEYIEGEPLSKLVGSMPIERIAPILAQVALAARYLEKIGFSHRDIKPDNIIITAGYKKAVLLDFGVLRPFDGESVTDHHSGTRNFVGTTRYSAPEFLTRSEDGGEPSYRAITFYQLGAVLHDMITGKRMFDLVKDEPYAKLSNSVQSEEVDLTEIRKGVPARLIRLATQCLTKNPETRMAGLGWESFSHRRLKRRPVVVLLYTGGTIGSSVANDASHQRGLRVVHDPEEEFLVKFKERILAEHSLVCGPAYSLPFELVWEILPPEDQLLSENAKPATWNLLAGAIEAICERYGNLSALPVEDGIQEREYLAGIVVLHGTDTLAYSAAAIAMALRNLPCPVVMTGSNQPPKVGDVLDQNPVSSTSDAWRNIRRCLLFLQSFGHRFTEVFVCFGKTIHSAVNIRKVSADRWPTSRLREVSSLNEPYFYRNMGAQRQYMFRFIEGLLVNNFYPVDSFRTYDMFMGDRHLNTYRHFRDSPLRTSRSLERSTCSQSVYFSTATPAPPPFMEQNVEGDLDTLSDEIAIWVIEGYSSGTLPTDPKHPMSRILARLIEMSIPIVLVTREGLLPTREPYEAHKIDGKDLPVVRLFGVIAETAVPLISVILNEIDASEWDAGDALDAYSLLLKRVALVESTLRRHQSSSPNILSSLLGDIVDEGAQLQRIESGVDRDNYELSLLTDRLFLASSSWRSARLVPRLKERSFDRAKTVLMREHFLWIFLEVARPYEVVGCGCDGFSVLHSMGFEWGRRIFEVVRAAKQAPDAEFLFDESGARKAERVREARTKMERLLRIVRRHGVADVQAKLDISSAMEDGQGRGKVSLELALVRHVNIGRADELFAVRGYSEDEARFFERMRDGVDLIYFDNECERVVKSEFSNLFERGPGQAFSVLEWFVLGAFKACLCGVLRDLRYDVWVETCGREEGRSWSMLRNSIDIRIIYIDEHSWRVSLNYRSRPAPSERATSQL